MLKLAIPGAKATANLVMALASEIPHPPPESLGFCVSSQWQAAAGGGFSDRQHSPFSILASFWVSTPSGQGWHTVGQLTALEAVLKVATKDQRHKEATKNIKNLSEILVSVGLSGENLDF